MKSELPGNLRALLPAKGLVLLSGGLTSSARRLTVDFSSGAMTRGAAGMGESSLGPMRNEERRQLTPQELQRAQALADVIWASPKSSMRMPPIADFDVRLLLRDGPRVKDIESYGPPVGEVDELYTFLWGLAADRRK